MEHLHLHLHEHAHKRKLRHAKLLYKIFFYSFISFSFFLSALKSVFMMVSISYANIIPHHNIQIEYQIERRKRF